MRFTALWVLTIACACAQPGVYNIRADSLSHSSLRLIWDNTSLPNKVRVRYGLTTAYEAGPGGGIQSYSTTRFALVGMSESVSGLASDTEYQFCPQSSTDGGNTWSECINFTATTTKRPDLHPEYPIEPVQVDTAYPDTTGYTIRNVSPDCSDLQDHLNAAAAAQSTNGSIIEIPAGTVCKGEYKLNGDSSVKSFSPAAVRTSTATITIPQHGFEEGQLVRLAGALPGSAGPDPFLQNRGVRPGDDYYVKVVDADSFQLAADKDGSASDFTTSTFTVDPATNEFTVPSTSVILLDGQTIQVKSTGVLPSGLSSDTTYYVKNSRRSETFQLSTSRGGPAIDITDSGSGTHSFADHGSGGHIMAWPPAPHWIIVRTATPDNDFVPAGVRVTPQWQHKMATFKPSGKWLKAYPITVVTGPLAHHWRFIGIEFTHDDTATTEIAYTIEPSGYFGFFASSRDAGYILLDRCYIHGLGFPNRIYRAITSFDGEYMGIIDSYWDKLDWWHPYRTGVQPKMLSGSVVTISVGTYYAGPFQVTLTIPVTVTLTGGSVSGQARAYFDMKQQLVIEVPTGLQATCLGYSPCIVQDTGARTFPMTPEGRMAAAPIARMDISNGAFTSIESPQEPAAGAPEGAQSFIAGNGPGPFLIQNNYISGTGIPVHFDDSGNGHFQPHDFTVRRNHFTAPLSQLAGGRQSDGRRYFHRNHLEWKSGIRILVDGNLFEHNFADVTPLGPPVAIMATAGGWITDVKISNNIFRQNAGGLLLAGGIDSGNPIPKPSGRFHVVNNFWYRNDGFSFAAPHVRPEGVTGIQIASGYAIEDFRIAHNTAYDNRGTLPSFLHAGAAATEGLSITDNVIWANSWVITSEGQGSNMPACSGYEKALLDCNFRSGPGNPDYTFNKNTVIAGWSDREALVPRDPNALRPHFAGADIDIFGQSDFPVRLGWLAPAATDQKVKSAKKPSIKERGVDFEELERAMGRIGHIEVTDITTESVNIVFTSPDKGAGCYVLYGTGDDISSYSRTAADRSDSHDRSIALAQLTAGTDYQYVVLCEYATEQPRGTFTTPQ